MRRLVKKLFVVSSACIALLGATMENAAAWTFTASGTIGSGYDYTGIFGSVGSLDGMSFSQVYNVDPAAYSVQSPGGSMAYSLGTNTGTVTETVTVNGVSKSFDFTGGVDSFGESILYTFLTDGTGPFDMVYQYQQGTTTDGMLVFGDSSLASGTTPLGISTSFDQTFSGTLPSYSAVNDSNYARSSFRMVYSNNWNNAVQFVSGGDVTITINPVTAVPETETYAMMLAGLGLMGTVVRRRKAKQTA